MESSAEARKDFHQRIDDLFEDLMGMSVMCLEMVDASHDAFLALDGARASRVVEEDGQVDSLGRDIEENCVELLARQAPVAVDLRAIIVIMRLAQHLERVGDLCVNICRMAQSLEGRTLDSWIESNMDEMFRRSRSMLARAFDAFAARELSIADELSALDDKVDRIYVDFFRRVDTGQAEGMDLVTRVVMVARFVERIADHAVDIGEHVRFLVHGYRETEDA